MITERLPAYLTEPQQIGHVFGVLKYEEKANSWVIEGEPAVIEMAKRLFPGSSGRGKGFARFPATKRSTGDLNWLMLRYPLTVEDPQRWAGAREQAVLHALARMEITSRPQRVTPAPEFTGQLRPFQEEALAFLLHNERVLLADEMGLGKTPVSLAWLATTKAFPALIVVMPHLVRQWVGEIGRFLDLQPKGQRVLWDDSKRAVHVIKGLKPYVLPQASIYIMHYLLLRGWKRELPEQGFKAVVFDELQELRHTGTDKYSAASLLAGAVPQVVGLSGTPIYNHGAEMWSVMNILEYHCLGDSDSFSREWCTGYGEQVVKDPELFGSYLRREGLMLRRTKDQVLTELPPKRRCVQPIDFDKGVYNNLIGPAVQAAVRIKETGDFLERGRLTREAVDVARRVTGVAKAPYVCAFVRALLEAGETVILAAYHHEVWDIYKEELQEFRPVSVTGHESPAQKEAAQQAFMAGRTNLIMVSLRAASGLNLQRAKCVVFGELDWSPAIHSQMEDRAHRLGQTDSVMAYYLVCDEGTDHDMQEALGLKVSQFMGITGDRPLTEDDKLLAESAASAHMQRVLERLRQLKRPS